jgi:hypothetical protein
VTEAELAGVLRLLGERKAESIVIGSSRDAGALEEARTVEQAWLDSDGLVLTTVDWPERAASWLRQARRFAAPQPDAWVATGRVPGWVRMGLRLRQSTDWQPRRTVATGSLADDALIAEGGPDTFDGLCGASADGGTWEISRTLLIRR